MIRLEGTEFDAAHANCCVSCCKPCHWAATGENIYDALDWGNPSGAGKLSALILFVGLPFLWILLYCVFLGRRCHRVATSESGKLPV